MPWMPGENVFFAPSWKIAVDTNATSAVRPDANVLLTEPCRSRVAAVTCTSSGATLNDQCGIFGRFGMIRLSG